MTTNEIEKINSSQPRTKWWVDLTIFLAFLVTMEPHTSGLAIHEWLALSMIGALTVHLLLNWDWVAAITRRLFGRMGAMTRLNYLLNWIMFIDGTLIMLSGVMISEVALPALGIRLPPGFTWRGLHSFSTNLLLILLGIHTALHWSWVANTFNRYFMAPIARLFSAGNGKDASA